MVYMKQVFKETEFLKGFKVKVKGNLNSITEKRSKFQVKTRCRPSKGRRCIPDVNL